jgi:hypothetical protein
VTVVNEIIAKCWLCRKQQCATVIREGLRARAMTHWRSIAACVDAHVGEVAARWDRGTTSAAVSLVHNVGAEPGAQASSYTFELWCSVVSRKEHLSRPVVSQQHARSRVPAGTSSAAQRASPALKCEEARSRGRDKSARVLAGVMPILQVSTLNKHSYSKGHKLSPPSWHTRSIRCHCSTACTGFTLATHRERVMTTEVLPLRTRALTSCSPGRVELQCQSIFSVNEMP